MDRLAALAHPQRLALFRLLVRRYPDQVPAGELVQVLQAPPNTVSSYLSTLRHAGLITQTRAGRSLLYRVDMAQAGALMAYLAADCCRGRPELCSPFSATSTGAPDVSSPAYNVLFICTGNSARSIFGEAILRDLGEGRFNAYSAGTRPSSELNPFALHVLEANGHDTSNLRAKTIEEFRTGDAPRFDFVFTVCDTAANEECPAWPGQPITAHWGQPDPVKATGTDPEKALAFRRTYAALRKRIEAFASLSIEALDRLSLQHAVDDLAAKKEPA
ncbi:ArsR family transcriptional regulator [Wenxinia marina]|nr:ArsR family transcriptional regulator [Wenxinia marina]